MMRKQAQYIKALFCNIQPQHHVKVQFALQQCSDKSVKTSKPSFCGADGAAKLSQCEFAAASKHTTNRVRNCATVRLVHCTTFRRRTSSVLIHGNTVIRSLLGRICDGATPMAGSLYAFIPENLPTQRNYRLRRVKNSLNTLNET